MELAERILRHLDQHEPVDSVALAQVWSLDHQKIVGAIKSLECLGDVIQSRIDTLKHWELTAEGRQMAQEGSHEAVVFQAIPPNTGIPQKELIQGLSKAVGQVGFAKAMSAGWLKIDKTAGQPRVFRKVDSIVDQVQLDLQQVQNGLASKLSEKAREDAKKRKLMQEVTVKRYRVTKGPKFTLEIKKSETDLTPEMIATGSWKTADFKPYNFEAMGIQPPAGHLHPLLKVRAEYRQIFLEMGFSEMPTNNFVESSFWNFDALFQPQQHPARDAQDTFFLSDPATSDEFPPDYLERVRQVHSTGGYGSQGYRMDWKLDDARKNVLRTHTTAVSARMLYQLAQSGPFKPQKYFSIDRVFRNETLDATHLAEFHQIEGVIADYGITLGDLVGILYEFFKKLGIEELRFKPAYNPYTEPSMEVFSYHKGLKKWVEIGNSGLFRPEMLLPMGLPEGVNVIGYGLSLERPTMIKYGIDNIRDLCGNKVNLKMVQENPICRLDKDRRNPEATLAQVTARRWDEITLKLEQLKSKVGGLHSKLDIPEELVRTKSSEARSMRSQTSSSSNNIVINADPEHPPYSILPLVKALASKFVVSAKTHIHSSVVGRLPSHCYEFLSLNEDQTRPQDGQMIKISLIWKHGIVRPNIIIREGDQFSGEANVARYFARLLDDPTVLPYDDMLMNPRLDLDLDNLTQHQYTNPSAIKTSLQEMKATPWLSGKSFSLVDVLVWSIIKANDIDLSASPLSAWSKKCSGHALFKSL